MSEEIKEKEIIEKTEVTEKETETVVESVSKTDDEGKISLRVGEKESTEESSEKDDKTKVDKSDVTDTKETTTVTDGGDEDLSYKGKKREDVIEMHKHASTKINEQGEELGILRKKLASTEMSDAEVLKNLTAADLKKGYQDERIVLLDMDPAADQKAYRKQQILVDDLRDQWTEKSNKESLHTEMSSDANKEFERSVRSDLKKDGMELTDEEFKKVSKSAYSYLDKGRLTKGSYHKALIDIFGIDKVVKSITLTGKETAREEQRNASDNSQERVSTKTKGKPSGTFVKLEDMTHAEIAKAIHDMTPQQRADFKTQLNA